MAALRLPAKVLAMVLAAGAFLFPIYWMVTMAFKPQD